MKSKRRDYLKDYISEYKEFIGVVHSANYKKSYVVLNDVAIIEGDGFKKIAPHLHLYNVYDETVKTLDKYDIIIFRAKAYGYNKNIDNISVKNFSLREVKDIKKVEGEYCGQ